MAKEVYSAENAEEMRALGRELLSECAPGLLVTCRGELGAGKTTFVQGMLEALGAEMPYTSPTFVIMKEYQLAKPYLGIKRVYHADAYRVTAEDFEKIGFQEWLEDREGLVILEWPEKVEKLLPERKIEFVFEVDKGERIITMKEYLR